MAGNALAVLKELDQAKYLSCLFVPEDKREAFASVSAFSEELKRIPLLVSEPLPGEIRLQWWRDVISGERAGEAANQPVTAALLQTMKEYHLPIAPVEAMAEARIFDLYHDPMPDKAALETYLGETEAAIIQLGNLILSPVDAPVAAEAAGYAGMAIGIAHILRQMRRTTARQHIYIPADLLTALGCNAEMIFTDQHDARQKSIIAMVALGRDYLAKFRQCSKTVTPALRPAFLRVTLCEPTFRKAEKLGAKAFVEDVVSPPLLTPLRLAYRAMRGW